MIEWVLVAIGLSGLIFGTITDIKFREVPDWLNYALMALGVSISALRSIYTSDYWFVILSIIGLGVGFGIGAFMYYAGQWGGGDAKALGGLGALFGSYTPLFAIDTYNRFLPEYLQAYNVGFIPILILNILVAGAIYGMIWVLVLTVLHFKSIKKQLKKESKRLHKYRPYVYGAALLFCATAFLFTEWYLRIVCFTIGFLCVFMLMTHAYVKALEKVAMIKTVPVSRARMEGEWIVDPVYVGTGKDKKKICGPGELGLTKEQLALLKHHNIETVKIKIGIPFLPAFLIGFIYTIIFGSVFSLVLIF